MLMNVGNIFQRRQQKVTFPVKP